MKLVRRLMLTSVLSVMFAGMASAVPITFQLDNVTIVGGMFPTTQTYSPGFPITGSGDIDLGPGTGSLSLSDYSIFIDINNDGNDAQIDITGWMQTITSIDGSGNVISTGGGTAACTNLGGLGGFICGALSPTVAGWPAIDGPSLTSSAVLDDIAQTITIVDNSSDLAGTVTQSYSYVFTPEPSTALLIGAGLGALGLIRRRRRA